MKYSVTNLSSRGVCLVGRNPVDIPANCTGYIIEFPDKETATPIIQRLKKLYPAIKFSQVKENSTTKMSFEEFAALAVSESKGSGWYSVTVDGLQDVINVRISSSEDEGDAIEKAYEKYGENA